VSPTDPPDCPEPPRRGADIVAAATGWTRVHPRWAVAVVLAVALALTALADWPHQATRGQLQADLESYVSQVRADVLSCGRGVEDSLSAYNLIMAGVSTERGTAEGIADRAAVDCTPSGNAMILDVTALQPPRSLARYHLEVGAAQLYGWASSDAVDAMQYLHALLVSPGDAARLAQLRNILADMQQRASAAQAVFDRAASAVGAPTESLSLDAIRPGVLVG